MPTLAPQLAAKLTVAEPDVVGSLATTSPFGTVIGGYLNPDSDRRSPDKVSKLVLPDVAESRSFAAGSTRRMSMPGTEPLIGCRRARSDPREPRGLGT